MQITIRNAWGNPADEENELLEALRERDNAWKRSVFKKDSNTERNHRTHTPVDGATGVVRAGCFVVSVTSVRRLGD